MTTATSDIWDPDGPAQHIAHRWHEVARENGWRPSTARDCISVLVRRRCRHLSWPGYSNRCICDEAASFVLTDHSRRWLDGDGRPVITWEPYVAPDCNRIADFRAWAADRGIAVEIGDRSPWCPGSTTLLILRSAR